MKKFISFVAVVAFAVVGITEGLSKEELNKMAEADMGACKASENIPDSDFALIMDHKLPETKNGLCYIGCMMTKRGFIVDGAFSRAATDIIVKSEFADKPDLLQKILDANVKCEAEVGTSNDKCVTGPKLVTCLEKNIKM